MKELYSALINAQKEFEPVTKTADNPFFKSKYVPLEAVIEYAQPILNKHKLGITQMVSNIDGESALTTTLFHETGEKIESTMPLLLTKADPQAQGSAITYARRYSYMAILGLVGDEDDDGNKATVSEGEPTYDPEKPATVKQKNLIMKMWGENEETSDNDFFAWYETEYGDHPKTMTLKTASEVINRLKEGSV